MRKYNGRNFAVTVNLLKMSSPNINYYNQSGEVEISKNDYLLIRLPYQLEGDNTYILNAVLDLSSVARTSLSIHNVVSSFNYTTVTYNTMPSYEETPEFIVESMFVSNPKVNVTSLINKWMTGTFNKTILIKFNEDISVDYSPLFTSDDAFELVGMTKIDSDNIESSDKIELANTVSVISLKSGVASHVYNGLSTLNARNQVNFMLVSNPFALAPQNTFGAGWSFSYDYTVITHSDKIELSLPIGSNIWFQEYSKERIKEKFGINVSSPSAFVSPDGNDYIKEVNSQKILVFKNKDQFIFNQQGRLIEVRTGGIKTELTYDTNNRITKISSLGDNISFLYNANNQVIQVSDLSQKRISRLTYLNNRISSIDFTRVYEDIVYDSRGAYPVTKYERLDITYFEYIVSGRITKIFNNKISEGVMFEYTSNKLSKVININMRNPVSTTNLANKKYLYLENNSRIEASNSTFERIYYNNLGINYLQVVNERDIISNRFETNNNVSTLPGIVSRTNKISLGFPYLEENNFNKLPIGAVQNSNDNLWKFNITNNLEVVSDGFINDQSLKITPYPSQRRINQKINLPKTGNIYQFKALIKTKNIVGNTWFEIDCVYDEGYEGYVYETYRSINLPNTNGEWQIFNWSFSTNYNFDNGIFKIFSSITAGEVYLDSIFIDGNDLTSKYNLLNNGYFTSYTLSGTNINSWDTENLINADRIIDNNTLFFKDVFPKQLSLTPNNIYEFDDNTTKIIEQETLIKGFSGDNYTLGAWIRFNNPNITNLEIKIKFYSGNTLVDDYNIPIEKMLTTWDYQSINFTTNFGFDKVEVVIKYSGYASCYIGALELIKSRQTNENYYTPSGELSQMIRPSGTELIYYDQNNNIEEVLSLSGNSALLSYNTNNQVDEAVDSFDNKVINTYDANKNLIKRESKTYLNGTIDEGKEEYSYYNDNYL